MTAFLKPAHCCRLLRSLLGVLSGAALIGSASANQPPLTPNQVAQLAYDAGFRGGSLLMAVAASSAESSYDPDAVCNNLHVLNSSGQPTYHPDGKPVIQSISSYDGSKLVLGQTYPLPGGGQGRVISHCRGLWQLNSGYHYYTDADAFSPVMSARRAWGISIRGRFWGKWTSVMSGAAYEPTRLATARNAARAIDPTVLPNGVAPGQRVETWTAGGGVRSTAGGAFLRPIIKGDTGTILSGPVIASITQGIQTSKHLWYQIQWDHGTTGWVVEEYLMHMPGAAQNAKPSYNPIPANNTVRVPQAGTTLKWTIGGSTKNIQLRFGTDPALTGAGTLKINGGLPTSWPTGTLEHYRNYYWRIDAESGNGTITQGPTWTFRSTPPPAQPLTFSNIQVSPATATVGQTITISGRISAPGPQAVIIGANVNDHTDKARDLVFNVPGGNVPTNFSRTFVLPAQLGPGNHNLAIAAWQDVNQNNLINFGDVRLKVETHSGAVIVRDLAQPTLTNATASPTTAALNQPVTLSATVSDTGGSGLQGVFFYRAFGETFPEGWTQIGYRAVSGNGPSTVTWSDIPYTEGRFWYQMEAVDLAGNRLRVSALSTVRVQIPDLSPPVVRWLNPTNGTTINGNVSINGEATDDRGIASLFYRINCGTWTQSYDSPAYWSVMLNPIVGTNVVEMRATNTAGKTTFADKLYLYYAGSNSDPSVFDERFDFSSNEIHPRWTLNTMGDSFENGVVNQRLQSANGGTASIYANKTVPPSANAVELRFTTDTGGSFEWRDSAFRTWRLRIRQNPRALEIGYPNNYQQISIPGNTGQPGKIRTWWTDGRIRVWFNLQNQTTPLMQDFSFPVLRLSELSGRMEFKSESSSWGVTTILDDVQLRALRPDDRFAIHSQDLKPGQNSKVRWASFAGRSYVIESSTTMADGSWTSLDQTTSNGLVTERTFSLPTGTRRFVRVREAP